MKIPNYTNIEQFRALFIYYQFQNFNFGLIQI